MSTRGYVNIYHNAEWITNYYHIATNIEKFPLVNLESFFFLVLCFYYCQSYTYKGDPRSKWVLSYINETLSMFPPEIRPFYVPYSSFLEQHDHIWFRRAVFVFISFDIGIFLH